MLDLDDVLPFIGEYGRYQKLLLWIVCLPACMPCGMLYFIQMFLSWTPKSYWCRNNELLDYNLTMDERRRLVTPPGDENGCRMFSVNYTNLLRESGGEWARVLNSSKDTWATSGCTNGWEWDINADSLMWNTVVMDWDLVCDKKIYPSIAMACGNLGAIVGGYVFGKMCDKLGRRKSFLTCVILNAVFGLGAAFSPEYFSWTFCLFMLGMCALAWYDIPFIIALEFVGADYRGFATFLTCIFFSSGIITLGILGYFIRDWQQLVLACTLPWSIFIIFWTVIPESPRWLMSIGKGELACKVVEKVAKVNKQQLPPYLAKQIRETGMAKRPSIGASNGSQMYQNDINNRLDNKNHITSGNIDYSMFDLFRTPNMRKKTILITFNWFANATVYTGIAYYGPSMNSNEWLAFILSAAVEIPSYFCMWFLMQKWGRKWPICTFLIIGGISAILVVIVSESVVMGFYLLGKFSMAGTYMIIYPFGGELYPTVIRGMGIGFSSIIGNLGTLVIPFIVFYSFDTNHNIPMIVMGIIAILAGLSTIFLPDTLHQNLPETLAEGEEYGKDWPMSDYLSCFPKKNISSSRDQLADHASSIHYRNNENMFVLPAGQSQIY